MSLSCNLQSNDVNIELLVSYEFSYISAVGTDTTSKQENVTVGFT